MGYDGSTNTLTLEEGGTVALSGINNAGSDDQTLSITGNILNLEDGGSVDLSSYLDNTDDQSVSYSASSNVLTLEDGGTVDLSGLNNAGSDDQQLTMTGTTLDLEAVSYTHLTKPTNREV